MSSHGIDGRKLSRKMGPRLALYKNLTVSVLRYERIRSRSSSLSCRSCPTLTMLLRLSEL